VKCVLGPDALNGRGPEIFDNGTNTSLMPCDGNLVFNCRSFGTLPSTEMSTERAVDSQGRGNEKSTVSRFAVIQALTACGVSLRNVCLIRIPVTFKMILVS